MKKKSVDKKLNAWSYWGKLGWKEWLSYINKKLRYREDVWLLADAGLTGKSVNKAKLKVRVKDQKYEIEF